MSILSRWRTSRFAPTRYKLRGRIAKGGQGEVYRASCEVVVKRLIRVDDRLHQERIRREFDAARRINHPNVVKVLDGDFGARPYIVMEYLHGEPLAVRMSRARRPEQALECVLLVLQAMQGVRELHENGLVHRDLKPDNIFVCSDRDHERAVVLDLGAVRFLTRSRGHGQTTTGMLIGTHGYMPPEQAAGEAVSEAADIYALGVILYESLVGELPSESVGPDVIPSAASIESALAAAVSGIHRLPSWAGRHDLAAFRSQVVAVVAKALSAEPRDRHPSVAEFAMLLERAIGLTEATLSPSEQAYRAPAQQRPAHAEFPGHASERKSRPWSVPALLLVLLAAAGVGLYAAGQRSASAARGGALPVPATSRASTADAPRIREDSVAPALDPTPPASEALQAGPVRSAAASRERPNSAPLPAARDKKHGLAVKAPAAQQTEEEIWQRMRSLTSQSPATAP
jgi:serine/threonine-protein kinase